jgi:hypothetical protein
MVSLRALPRLLLFERLFRTTELFGISHRQGGQLRFLTGGPVGNALLLASLTSGPELAR